MTEEAPDQELKEIKKRALRRLVIAIVLIAAAVALLTFLSRFQPGKILTTSAPEPTRIIPPEPRPIEQPIEQSPVVVDQAPQTEETPAAPPAPGTPTATEPPPPPQVINEPETRPGAPKGKSEPKLPAARPLVKSERPQPAREEMQPAPQQPPAPKETARGFVVQLGVFSNPANALQLQEKLKEHGIKSYTETKVHIGPFKDKAEAETAVAKLKSLGISAVIVPQH